MHAFLTFLASALLFAAAVYGLLHLYKKQNGGLYPWQSAPTPPATKPGSPGSPPAPK